MTIFSSQQVINTFSNFHDPKNLNEIRQYYAELKTNRLKDIQSVAASVSELRENIQGLKTNVLNTFLNGANSAECLNKEMYKVEDKITQIVEKIQIKFLLLSNNENVLRNDLAFVEQRIKTLIKPLNPKLFLPVKYCNYKKNREQNTSSKFQSFLLDSGGHLGGWTGQDHFLFLKERNKFSEKKFIISLHTVLPNMKVAEIVAHENWFEKYENLKNSHKKMIEKWKAEKKYETQEKKEKSCKKLLKEHQSRKNTVQRITKWKEKQLTKNFEEERNALEKLKLQEEERKKKEIHNQKKISVSYYKTDKFNSIRKEMLNRLNGEINSFKKKVHNFENLKLKEKKRNVKMQAVSKVNRKCENSFRRAPQRIFKSTFVWSRHCEEKENTLSTSPSFNLKSIPRRGVPDWRKELKFYTL